MFEKTQMRAFIGACARLMEENKQYLIDLDSALGDGDLGLTMTAGFAAAQEFVESSDETDLGKLAAQAGMAMSRKVPSTMGTLMASALMGAGKAVKGKTAFDDATLAAFVSGLADGVMQRGKAGVGDRTIVDALKPGADAFAAAVQAGSDAASAARAALDAARKGRDATMQMQAKFGRGVYYGDQVLGKVDQGAVVGALIFEALSGTLG